MVPVLFLRRLAAAILLGLLAAQPLAAQGRTVWHRQLPAKIKGARVFPNGHLGVFTDSGLVVLSAEDGREMWQAPGVCCYQGRELADVGVLWGRDSAAVAELDGGRTLWVLKRNVPIDTFAGVHLVPERNLLLGYGGVGDSGYRIVAASLDSGSVQWQHDTLFRRVRNLRKKRDEIAVTEWQPPLYDSDSTVVIFPTKGGAMRLDIRTGALLWRVESLAEVEPPFARAGYAYMAADSAAGVVLIPYEQRLMAVRANDGTVLWTRDKFPSRLAEVEVTRHGYLVRGYYKGDKPSTAVKPFVDLLDPATGSSRWGPKVREIDDASAMLVSGDTVWLASKRWLLSMALPRGELRQRTQLSLKGDELPSAIEEREGVFVLLSPHNLVGVERDGRVRWQRHYPAPGSSFLSKVVGVTLLVGTAALAQAHGYRPIYVPGPKPVADLRYARALSARRYVHILTGAKDSGGTKGFSVVRLDKTSGEEVGRVWVNERSPDYVVDGAAGLLYLLRDERTVEALRF